MSTAEVVTTLAVVVLYGFAAGIVLGGVAILIARRFTKDQQR